MDATQWKPGRLVTPALAPVASAANLEALTDRIRQVRRQLSRGKPLSQVLDHPRRSAAALHAAQRLESAVRRLSDETPLRRVAHSSMAATPGQCELPWLVKVVEQRAITLEAVLEAESH